MDAAVAWTLAIDYGTTNTCAAVVREGDDPEILLIEGLPRLPSLVVASGGSLLTGRIAANQVALRPSSVERTPKRYLGVLDTLPIGEGVAVVDAVAAVLRRVLDEAKLRFNGAEPARVVLTHPVRWEDRRRDALRAAAKAAGMPTVELVREPVAAGLHFAAEQSVPAGGHIAIYDLGGGTYDTAVLRAEVDRFEIVGVPGGDPEIGGERFDEVLLGHVGKLLAESDPQVWAALTDPDADNRTKRDLLDLRARVRDAKEALSRESVADIHVLALDRSVQVTRAEFEELIGADIAETVTEMEATLKAARVTPEDLYALYLTGDSSRIPAIGRALSERFAPLQPTNRDDPKSVVALGATRHQPEPVASPLPPATPARPGAPMTSRLLPEPALISRFHPPDGVNSVAFSADGSRVAIAGTGGLARVWDAATGDLLEELAHDGKSVSATWGDGAMSVAFSPADGRVATGGTDRTVRVWQSGEEVVKLAAPAAQMLNIVAFSPDGRLLAGEELQPGVHVWDTTSGELLFSGTPPEVGVCVQWLDQRSLYVGRSVWKLGASRLLPAWQTVPEDEIPTRVGPLGSDLVISFGLEPRISLTVRTSTGECLREFTFPWATTEGAMQGPELSPDGRWIAVGGFQLGGPVVELWDVHTGERGVAFHTDRTPGLAPDPDGGLQFAFSGDGLRLAATGVGGCMTVWQIAEPAG